MDFNRANDGAYVRPRQYMPLANFTYDLFSIAGEGTGGTFRTSRSDVGVVFDSEAENNTVGFGIGVGPGFGNTAKINSDLNGSYGFSRSDRWKADDGRDFDIISRLDFKDEVEDSIRTYEPYYFRNTAENNISDQDYYNSISDADAVSIQLDANQVNTKGVLTNKFKKKNAGDVNVAADVYRRKTR